MDRAIDRAATLTKKGLGQTLYTRLHWTLSMSPTMFSENEVSWPRMKQGFEDYLKLYPEMATRNNYAMFACRANDVATVAEQMKLIGHSVDMNAWNSWADYELCKARTK